MSYISNESRSCTNEYLTSVTSGLQRDQGEYLTAIDSQQQNDTRGYVTSVDGRSHNPTEQYSGSLETGRHTASPPLQARFNESNQSQKPSVDGINMSSTRTGSNRLSSAMKLKCNVEPQSQPQEHVVSPSHNPVSPSTPSQSSATSSAGVLRQERKLSVSAGKPSSPSSHPAAERTSTQSRRTLSNEPLGAEFDVKQIRVRRGAGNSTSSNDQFDFFADMEPVITSSSALSSSSSVPQKSLLGLLTAAAAEGSSPELSSQLSITDQNYLDSSVSCCHIIAFLTYYGVPTLPEKSLKVLLDF